MEVSGRIKKVFETQSFPSGFSKREIVVTTQEQYPQDLLIEFYQDKISLLDNYKEGDEVKISINLRGREWINPEGVAKYFNSISGWRIEKVGVVPQEPQYTELPPITEELRNPDDGPDDLPF